LTEQGRKFFLRATGVTVQQQRKLAKAIKEQEY
jgi:ribosomal protein S18